MAEPIEDWVDAALVADVLWMRSARAIVFVSPSRDQVRSMIEAVAPLVAAAERERICKIADDVGARYLDGGDWSASAKLSDLIRRLAIISDEKETRS